MEILVLQPHGYCPGVKRALDLARLALKDEDSPLVMLGGLVHNETVIASLQEEGFVLPKEENPLDTLLSVPSGTRILFSAHGHPLAYEDICDLRNLPYYDGTCPFVQENLEAGRNCEGCLIYCGIEGHQEAIAFLTNVPEAIFYDVKTGAYNLIKAKGKQLPVYIICQTTLGNDEISKAVADIKKDFPDATLLKENCPSSHARQKVVADLEGVDALIIMGSKTSANSRQLVRIGQSKGIESHLCLDVNEVEAVDLSGKKKIALGSGASVPEATLEEALTYLQSL